VSQEVVYEFYGTAARGGHSLPSFQKGGAGGPTRLHVKGRHTSSRHFLTTYILVLAGTGGGDNAW